ncbi:MAG TPA: hypothetical protein VKZ73_03600 [Microbacterium sp.]|nr:hypothetical protein [Microbacterium sp.]
MTATISRPDTIEEFDRALDEVLIGIASRAVEREQSHTLLYDEVRTLQSIGFGSVRLPAEHGGLGLSFEQLVERLILVASADSNLAHLYRGHIAVVEEIVAGYDADDANREAWIQRIARGEFVGNAQSEKQETGEITTRIERDGDRILLTGRKFYTTGSIYADWIRLAALDGETRVGVTVSTKDPGVESIDDWDGFGQPLTGTGTTVFERVAVDPADIIVSGEHPARGHHIASVFQLILLASAAGIGRAALRDAVEFVRPRRRIFGFPGETPPREDTLVQETIGSVSARADAAVRLVVSGARDVDRATERYAAGDEDAYADLLIDVYRLQQIVAPLVLDAATEIFEVGGASAVSTKTALDRHWRNARTVHSHNPAAQRRRVVGDFELNGTRPDFRAPGAPTAEKEAVTA